MFHRLMQRTALTGVLLMGLALPSVAQDGVAGSYLAARSAGFSNDFRAAAQYYDVLLLRDPNAVRLLDPAMVSYAMLGDFERAGDAAARAISLNTNLHIAPMVRVVRDLQRGNLDAASAMIEAGEVGGPLLDGLLTGWVRLADGNMSGATEAFDALAETAAFAPYAYVHKALALAMVGDFEGADAILSGDAHGPLAMNVTGISAHLQVLSQLDRAPAALELLEVTTTRGTTPELEDMRRRLDAGETLAFDIVTTPEEGMAEAFQTLASVVNGEASTTYTLLHSRAALALNPENVDAILLSADLLEQQDQYDLASEVLDAVPVSHPAFHLAEISRAEVLMSGERPDAAVEVLKSLTRSHGDILEVQTALGDTLRRQERHAEARDAYDRAVALVEDPTRRNWFLYYARGITYERTQDWEGAEENFRRALELNPDQPHVLNYLGYSLVERKEKLVEALEMIQTAVAARPDDGYITDSLGWVFYRLGRFAEAVEPMERAVALQPLDPVINDHLGDVYWAVNRKREAEFQWRRALSNIDPDDTDSEADPDRIRRKLEVGLDRVLAEEGAISLADKAAAAGQPAD